MNGNVYSMHGTRLWCKKEHGRVKGWCVWIDRRYRIGGWLHMQFMFEDRVCEFGFELICTGVMVCGVESPGASFDHSFTMYT